MCRFASLFFAVVLVCLKTQAAGPAESHPAPFGFTGPEIFPIDPQISLLHAADLDGDGLQDLIVVNNARSKIELLYNQTGKTNKPATDADVKPEINDLPPDSRFRIESIASEKTIFSLVVADLNGDGRPDLAYYGNPKELVVIYNEGSNHWSTPKRWPIDDGQLSANALTSGDLSGEKRPGLILLGDNNLYYLPQNADHTLGEPRKIPFSGSAKAVQAIDIDGDGRQDLLLINWDSPNPFRFRLQNAEGELGPEMYFTTPPIRAYMADDLEGNHKTEIVTIAQNSGRAQVYGFERKPAEPLSHDFKEGQFSVLPLNKTTRAHRPVLWADVNGDGLADLIEAEPDSGQLTVHLQKPDGTLGAAKTFPTLTGVSSIAVSDWEEKGRQKIFLLSDDEHQIGVTEMDTNGRIPFPTILPLDGRPLTMAIGPLQPQAKPTLCVIADQDTNRVLLTITADGNRHIQKISGSAKAAPSPTIVYETNSGSLGNLAILSQKLSDSFKAAPSSMIMHDANQDGLADLVILIPYEKIKFLVQRADHSGFDEADVAPPGGSTEEPWASTADVDGDGKAELLLAQKNFIRAVVLTNQPGATTNDKPEWSFIVKEQINGTTSDSRITGAAPLRNGANAIASLFLLDDSKKTLTLCERDKTGVWQVMRNISLPVSDFNFTGLASVGFGSKTPNSISLIGANAVGTMAMSGEVWQLSELDSYETPIKDGHLSDVIAGDLNNDGRKDLVFLETAKNYLDIVTFELPHKLVPATRWPVFEERTFRSRRNDSLEPREALVADVTGDKKNDLIVIVHDRVIVYPQE